MTMASINYLKLKDPLTVDELAMLRGWLWSIAFHATLTLGDTEFTKELRAVYDEVRTQFVRAVVPSLEEFLAMENRNKAKDEGWEWD